MFSCSGKGQTAKSTRRSNGNIQLHGYRRCSIYNPTLQNGPKRARAPCMKSVQASTDGGVEFTIGVKNLYLIKISIYFYIYSYLYLYLHIHITSYVTNLSVLCYITITCTYVLVCVSVCVCVCVCACACVCRPTAHAANDR